MALPARRADAVSVQGVTRGAGGLARRRPQAAPRVGAQGVGAPGLGSAADSAHAPRWGRGELSGVLTELSSLGGAGALSLAFSLVLDAQAEGETVAWVTDSESSFFPPDAAAAGVDLEELAVIRVPGVPAMLKSADRLVRSGWWCPTSAPTRGRLRRWCGDWPAWRSDTTRRWCA